MGRRFLIAGTGPRVGKTTVGCALGFALRARGLRVGVMKPVDTLESQDAQALALAVGTTVPIDMICPCRYNAQAHLKNDDLKRTVRCFREIESQSDVVLVEAASRVNFGILARLLKLEMLLIVGNRPGCVDAMKRAAGYCEEWSARLAGCILCDCEPDAAPYVDTLDTPPSVPYLGRMRHREPLAKAIVEKLL